MRVHDVACLGGVESDGTSRVVTREEVEGRRR